MPVTTAARQRLTELTQAAADAQARVDSLEGRARSGGQVSGADLATARANLELAKMPIADAEAAAAAEHEADRRQRNSDAADQVLQAETVTKQAFVAAAADVRQALAKLKEVADQHAQLVAWGIQEADGAQPTDRLGWRHGGIPGVGAGVTLLVDRRAIPSQISFGAWVARLQTEVLGTAGAPDPTIYPVEAAQT